jgi:hypothetical protein
MRVFDWATRALLAQWRVPGCGGQGASHNSKCGVGHTADGAVVVAGERLLARQWICRMRRGPPPQAGFRPIIWGLVASAACCVATPVLHQLQPWAP